MYVKTLKETVSIFDVAEKFGIDLKRAKVNPCPFCHSSKAFKVYDEKFYKCFRCGKNGSIFDLLVDMGLAKSFQEALSLISKNFNQVGQHTSNMLQSRHYSAMEQIFEVYKSLAEKNKPTVEKYFASRGWKLVKPVGLATSDDCLQRNGLAYSLLESANFIENNNEFYDHHIIFPVYNRYGSLCHFTARALDDRELRWKSTKGFLPIHKCFYNSEDLYKPRSSLLVICEGASDCYSLMQFKEISVIGQFGINVKLTDHYKAFEAFDTLLFAYDSDTYGLGTDREGQYKSWSMMLPEIVELQTLIKKPIFCFPPPSELGVTDINEWLQSVDYDRSEVNRCFKENVLSLSELCLRVYQDEPSKHSLILSCLKNFSEPTVRETFFSKILKTHASLEDYLIQNSTLIL